MGSRTLAPQVLPVFKVNSHRPVYVYVRARAR